MTWHVTNSAKAGKTLQQQQHGSSNSSMTVHVWPVFRKQQRERGEAGRQACTTCVCVISNYVCLYAREPDSMYACQHCAHLRHVYCGMYSCCLLCGMETL